RGPGNVLAHITDTLFDARIGMPANAALAGNERLESFPSRAAQRRSHADSGDQYTSAHHSAASVRSGGFPFLAAPRRAAKTARGSVASACSVARRAATSCI